MNVRPRWWAQLALPISMFIGYDTLCRLRPHTRADGLHNAYGMLHGWASVGLGQERAINNWVAGVHPASWFAARYYDIGHFGVTIAVLIALYIWAPTSYRVMRDALWIVTAIALVVFWLHPLAPPRMLPGFHDVVGSITGSSDTSSDPSFYSAMPSLHMAWAVWSAVGLFALLRRPWTRALAVMHPVLTVFAVLATANHWALDVIVGAVVAGAALAIRYGVTVIVVRLPRLAPAAPNP